MATRKVTKASKMRLLVFGSICIFVIVYFIISTFSMIFNIKSLSREQNSLENNLTELQNEETNLTKELEKLKNDEYKARYAREYFLYSKENGEYIFTNVFDSDEDAVETSNSNDNFYFYLFVGGAFVILVIIIFIIKRVIKK